MHSTAGGAHDETVRLHSQHIYYTKSVAVSQKKTENLAYFSVSERKKSGGQEMSGGWGANGLSNLLASTKSMMFVGG